MRTNLVARTGELDRLRRTVLDGRGAVVLGEAGVGRTALAAALADELPTTEPVVWIVATAAARLIPFGALAPLLPASLSDTHPALLPQLVLQRLREPAGGRPLLVVDDAHLLDDHSAATLLTIVTAGGARVLATARSGVRASDAVRALWKDRLLERVELAPLDRPATRSLLHAHIGGMVAEATVERLWQQSRGNPLYLTELVRHGLAGGQLRRDAGVWWWRGAPEAPPGVDELFGHRFDELSTDARDALGLLALGEPLPYETLTAVVPRTAVTELDERALVTSDEHGPVVRLRFAHPLIRAAAERRLHPARRRDLAERLRRAPADHVGLTNRAEWEEAASAPPDVNLLLSAAESILLTEPRTAARFAARAVHHDTSPRAAVSLSNAHAELGQLEPARAALAVAADRVRDDQDRLTIAFEDISLSVWSERRPADAAVKLRAVRAALPTDFADELDTASALLSLFTARPGAALRATGEVLTRRPGQSALIRALTVRLAALALADRPDEAMSVGQRLLALLGAQPPGGAGGNGAVAAHRHGLAHAIVGLAHQLGAQDDPPPTAYALSGRWPARPDEPPPEPLGFAWPLLAGLRRHAEGDWAAAVPALREAFVHQSSGEGLFRSEAAAALVAALAEAGHVDEAERVLHDHPPDGVAVLPALLGWAQAALTAATGRPALAATLAITAARQSAMAGAPGIALWYLADAARYGSAGDALAELDSLGTVPRSALAKARAAGIQARAAGDADRLLAAAERHLALGLRGHAVELAELGALRAGIGRAATVRTTRAAAVLHAGRDAARPAAPSGPGLGGSRALLSPAGAATGRFTHSSPADGADAGLTKREREIALMAAEGMSDRDIAAVLVVSVRTVESHLSSAYRKLGIRSRRTLGLALHRAG